MLKSLSIRNFAIIETLDIEFDEGLNVLTGETGAGKSILVGALSLVLGKRANMEAIRTGEEAASVTAVFSISKLDSSHPALAVLIDLEIPYDDELIIRRRIVKNGKSAAWVNDTSVTVQTLAEIAGALVDIAGQRQHQSLLDVEQHLFLLDALGGLAKAREEAATLYEHAMASIRERRALAEKAKNRAEREDFLRFQLGELSKAKLAQGEDDALEKERSLLMHAEKIRSGLSNALRFLDDEDAALVSLGRAEGALGKIGGVYEEAGRLSSRVEAAMNELEDVALLIRDALDSIEADPERLDEVEGRLALIGRLCKKHGGTLTDVLEKKDAIEKELAALEDLEASFSHLDETIRRRLKTAYEKARLLSEKRGEQGKALSKAVMQELNDLSMTKTRFEVKIAQRPASETTEAAYDGFALASTGIDEVEFMIAPNVGEALKPLAKIASGGELSRIMLAIKGVMSLASPIVANVFDEVDQGISGKVAAAVGRKIGQFANRKQVICISHLPQVAAFGDKHFLVEKRAEKGRTFARVETLETEAERIGEIARLLSGEEITSAAKAAAQELISAAVQARKES